MPISINWISRVLTQLDPQFFAPLKKHIGKTGQIYFLDYNESFYIHITPCGCAFEKKGENPNFTLSGASGDFFQLIYTSSSKSPAALFAKYQLTFKGDTRFLNALHQCFLQRDFNWEGHLSRIIGSLPALAGCTMAEKAKRWTKNLLQARKRDMTLFLQEEQKYLPTRYELEAFYDAVDSLKEASDRLQKRIEFLKESKNELS